jgi:hypothetical protein
MVPEPGAEIEAWPLGCVFPASCQPLFACVRCLQLVPTNCSLGSHKNQDILVITALMDHFLCACQVPSTWPAFSHCTLIAGLQGLC